LLRNARAGTTSPRRCTSIRRKRASTHRTQAFTGRRHPHPPGGVAYATKSADHQPAVAGNTDAVPRESSIVRRPTTHDQRAAGVSPPWVCKPRMQRQRGEFPRFELACRVHSTGGMASTGGLTPPALVLRCESLPMKKRFLRCTNAHLERAAGVSPPWVL
jgi:hypothetical protein